MIRSILLLCILATALGEILPVRTNYLDYGYRRQIGDTRDEKVPPHYQHVYQNTRRHHKPVLRNEKPLRIKREPFSSNKKAVIRNILILSLRHGSSISEEDISKANERTDMHQAVRQALRGDSYKHRIRKDENKLSKRDNSNDDLNRDAENVEYRENAESVKRNEEVDVNYNLLQPEIKTEPSLDINSLPDQNYFEQEGKIHLNQGYHYPQTQGQYKNSPQSETQGFNAPQDPTRNENVPISQVYDSPQDQIQSPTVPNEIQEYISIVSNRGQNGLQRNLQGSTPLNAGQIPKYIPYQGGQEYNVPQSLDLKRDFNLNEGKERGYTSQTLSQNQDYAYQGVVKGCNAPLGQNQDYNDLCVKQDYSLAEGSGNPPLGLGSPLEGPSYPPTLGIPSTGQNYNPPEGSGLNLINAPGGFENVQGGLGNAPGGFGNAQDGFGNAQGGFGYAQDGFGNAQGGFGNAQGGFGNTQGSFGNAPGSMGNAPGMNIVPDQQYSNPTQIIPQGQINNQYQNQQLDCRLTGQCNSNNNYQVRNKMFQLIRNTKLAIDKKVMPIKEVHSAYKENRLYRIGYLISTINKTQDSVADFYRYVKQNINSWDYLTVLQAYEQVKAADAFVSNVLYTLNQLVNTVSVFDMMRSEKPSVLPLQSSKNFYPKVYDKQLDDDELNWLYYDD